MTRQAKSAVRQVLRKAPDTPNWFDQSDAERLVRLMELAFERGRRVALRRRRRR